MENKKVGLLKNDKMGSYEKERGYASYRTVINMFISDAVLCNEIAKLDDSIFYNVNENYCEETEIYQYYLCNLSEYEQEQLTNCGIILSYSDMLDCDVLMVDHFGTSWDYVLTNVKLFDNYEDLVKYEEESEED